MSEFYCKGILWSPSYLALGVGGATLPTLKKYIQGQKDLLSFYLRFNEQKDQSSIGPKMFYFPDLMQQCVLRSR